MLYASAVSDDRPKKTLIGVRLPPEYIAKLDQVLEHYRAKEPHHEWSRYSIGTIAMKRGIDAIVAEINDGDG